MKNATQVTIQQVKELLVLQDQFNTQVNPDWKTAGQDWETAVLCESAEMMESYGYKWWKKQTPDMNNVRLELIDIYHFLTSFVIEKDKELDLDKLAQSIVKAMSYAGETEEKPKFAAANYSMLYYMVTEQPTPMFMCFASLCEQAELSWEDLYKGYIAKNALNAFRANNGYKQGTYQKIWESDAEGDKEDNYFLMNFIDNLDMANTSNVYGLVYDYLTSAYSTVQK